MSLEDELLKQRLERIREIEALGGRAYGRRYDFTHTIPEILAGFGGKSAEELTPEMRVRAAGRVMTLRLMGKAGFAHLQQNGERLQIYVKKDAVGESDFALFKALDIGDIVGVEGYVFRTRTGELSVHVEKLEFLSKTLLSMPEKWHGLEDVETRYRQRYLDLIANPEVRKAFITRAKIVSSLRRQLEARGFVEVETPMMQPLYGGAAARPFVTHHNTLDIDLYLRIAPELYLKRLVVGGLERVYEINRNFRNEGLSTHHNPEFTMLEFYQAYADYRTLMDFTAELLKQTALDAAGSTEIEFEGRKLDFSRLERYSMREAVVHFWEGADAPTPADVADPAWLARHSHKATPGEALTDIFERTVEEKLIQPTIIYDYPVETSPLSKNKPEDPAFVERFEIYAAGMEIGNAYTELNDPQEQRRRFEMQIAMRERGDEEAHQMDEDYVRALAYGMPPTAGEGIGIDRLAMILTGMSSIRDVILFPLLRPEGPIGLADRLRTGRPVISRFELFVAGRYLRARRKEAVISVITAISVAGVAAGVMALVIAVAVTNGFRSTLQTNLLGAMAHINVLEKQPGAGIEDWRAMAARLRQVPHVTAVAPALYEPVTVTGALEAKGVYLKGVEVNRELATSNVLRRLKTGSIDRLRDPSASPPGIILGARLSEDSGMTVDSNVDVMVLELTPLGPHPSPRRFRVCGIFETGFYDIDDNWAYVSLPALQKAFSLEDVVNQLELRVDNLDRAGEIAQAVQKVVGPRYVTTTWMERNRPLLSALRTERIGTIVTIGLIELVAALNILITLVMMVMEKYRDIAVLMSMGAKRAQIRRIFMLQGVLIGVAGSAIGLAVGYALCYLAGTYRWIPLDETVYSMSYVPFDARPVDAIWIAAAAVLVSFLATIYPARNATRITPAEVLRYE